MLEYVYKKQSMLGMSNEDYNLVKNDEDLEPDMDERARLSDNVMNALVYKCEKYIIFVMEYNPESLLYDILCKMSDQGLIVNNTIGTEVDVDEIDDWIELPLDSREPIILGN